MTLSSGSLNNSGNQDPVHTFSTYGTFNVSLRVTNADGCYDTIFKPVSVDPAPQAAFIADTVCFGNLTSFTDQSAATQGTITSWNWNFGDPSSGTNNTSTLQNPTHIFTGAGSYLVTLHVTGSNACPDDTSMYAYVNPKPFALFEYGPACTRELTKFRDLSTAPGSMIRSWSWNFGDGGTDTIQNPEHAYQLPGTYYVTLVVKNQRNCSDSITIPVIARPNPVAKFTYTNFFCPAGQVNFQDESRGSGAAIVSHFWFFEPGFVSTQVNPVHVFSVTDTTYLVAEIVTDNFGCRDTVTDSVYVKPAFSFTFTNDTVCFGNMTHFHPVDLNPQDSLYVVTWNFGDPDSGPGNTSDRFNAAHVFTKPGSYVVTMKTINSDNCIDSILRTVDVYHLPQPEFNYSDLPCDSNLYFHDSTSAGSGAIAWWSWDWGDGSLPTVIPAPGPGDATHLYINPGSYTVRLTVSDTHGCSDTIIRVVQRAPCIKSAFLMNDTLVCARYPVTFTDSSSPVSRVTGWHWVWGDSTPDTSYSTYIPEVHHTFPNGGTFDVQLIVSTVVSGITIFDTAIRQVTVRQTPVTLFSNPAACLGQPNFFSDTSATFGVDILHRYWNFGEPSSGTADTSSSPDPVHSYDSAGIFDVRLLVINKYGCKDSLIKGTTVNKPILVRFSTSVACAGNPTYFYDRSVTGDTISGNWLWNFGDAFSKTDSSFLQNPVHIYKTKGNYPVVLWARDMNGCSGTYDSIISVHATPVSTFTVSENFHGMAGSSS